MVADTETPPYASDPLSDLEQAEQVVSEIDDADVRPEVAIAALALRSEVELGEIIELLQDFHTAIQHERETDHATAPPTRTHPRSTGSEPPTDTESDTPATDDTTNRTRTPDTDPTDH